MSKMTGKIIQIIGPVVDVSFEETGNKLPSIHEALEITRSDGDKLILEVQQHTGENTVRTISMDATDGLQRGMDVLALGHPITMPLGDTVKGRLLNVVGEAIDGIGSVDKKGGYQIHNHPPAYENLSTETEVLFTGIKVID